MRKYIAQIIYFPYILSLGFVLSHAKLKETNEETGLFSSFTQRNLQWVAYYTQVPKFLPLQKLKKQNSNKILKFGKPCFPRWRRGIFSSYVV
jgi:hypothetical protein